MGRISDRFGRLEYRNEAEVSQNFLLPLLTEFLGYQADEIIPEHLLPSIEIPLNRGRAVSSDQWPARAKPDYIVTFDGQTYVLLCDSKGPDESLEEYRHQLIAYCIAARTNLLLTTNGVQVQIYSANTLVFQSLSIDELDLRYSELHKLLNRSDAAQYTDIERLQRVNLPRALGKDATTLKSEQKHRTAVALSSFGDYLSAVAAASEKLELPPPIRNAFDADLLRFPAEQLYVFEEYTRGDLSLSEERPISYETILQETPGAPLLLVGESGIGKSSLLQQLAFDQAQTCLRLKDAVIPVLVKLRRFGSGQSLNQLVTESLISRNADISQAELPLLLRDGRLVLLLDAFDEVFDPNAPDLEQQIQALVEDSPRCKVIITTRDFRLPRVAPTRRYRLERLSQDRIEAFAQMYLGDDAGDFVRQLAQRGLLKVASNTLLLTLLILLHLDGRELPLSRGQIIESVLERVHDWHESKGERFQPAISWSSRMELLTRLAYSSLASGKSYTLDAQSIETTLAEALDELETRRQIRGGLELDHILDSLAATGLITRIESGIVFWHSAFLEFLAAAEVAQRLETEPGLLESLMQKPEWEEILVLAAWRAKDPSALIHRMLLHNVFTAGKALLECNLAEGPVYEQLVDALVDKCKSETLPIRQIATLLLRQVQGTYADTQFYDLLDSRFVDVQKVALVEIARRKLPGAREIVFSRLAWDARAPTWREGSSSNAVIEALGEFDDVEAHLQIIDFWHKKPDMFTDESCQGTLLRVAERKKISSQVRDALLDFYLDDGKDTFHGTKVFGLAEVLIALGDSVIVPPLMASIQCGQDHKSPFPWETLKILASFSEPGVVDQLIEASNNQNLDAHCRARFAQALTKIQGFVPLGVFQALAEDADDEVSSQGIRGLARFPVDQVRETVLQLIRTPEPDQSFESRRRYARIQEAAFEVLAKRNQLELLLEEENQPRLYSFQALEVLLNSMVSNRLHSLLPLLNDLVKGLKDWRMIVQAAWVFADLGHIEQAQEMVQGLRQPAQDWMLLSEILQGIHRLPISYAFNLIDEFLASPEEAEERRGYLMTLCIEALERIGTSEACDRLTQITLMDVAGGVGIDAERAIRAIEFLAPKEKENWLIELVEEHPNMQKHALRRTLETLGVIGGSDSLPVLQRYFQEPGESEVQLVCFWAIQSIYKRAGQLWFNGEERVS